MKECIICKKLFKQKSNVQKTCSEKCRKLKDKNYEAEYRKKNFDILKRKKEKYDKEYRRKNKKNLNKISREYYYENKDTKIKKCRLKRRKEILKYSKKYNEEHRKELREYAIKNRGKRNEKTKEYREKYKEKDKARAYARRHKQVGEICEKCGETKNLEFHHTNYEKREGITLCRKCHNIQHSEYA